MTINILITSCNDLVGPSIIKCLNFDPSINIIGADANPIGPGRYFADDFVEVPRGDDPKFIEKMFDACDYYNINYLIPTNDLELLPLASNVEKFERADVELIISDSCTIKSAGNKRLLFENLKSHGGNYPEFCIPTSVSDLKSMAANLGYPDRPVVIKPDSGRGSRGVKIIDSNVNYRSVIFEEKPDSPMIDLETLCYVISNSRGKFPDLVLMEYLPGKEYSVDVLLENFEPLWIVPKERVVSEPGHSLINIVDLNYEIFDEVKKICDIFEFKHIINMQFKYSLDGIPKVYEVNPRVAASIHFSKLSGANLLYQMIMNAEGKKTEDIDIIDGNLCMRYLKSISD